MQYCIISVLSFTEINMPSKTKTTKLTTETSPKVLIEEINRLKELMRSRLRSGAPISRISKDPFAMVLRSTSSETRDK
jgi:GGDEF domain-containing protein